MTTDFMKDKREGFHEAKWVREMKEHFARTGCYRAEDLRRLLGDPKRGVTVGPNESMRKYFLVGR